MRINKGDSPACVRVLRSQWKKKRKGDCHFSDTVIWRSDQGPKMSSYRKPTIEKDDFIHYLSANGGRANSSKQTLGSQTLFLF